MTFSHSKIPTLIQTLVPTSTQIIFQLGFMGWVHNSHGISIEIEIGIKELESESGHVKKS